MTIEWFNHRPTQPGLYMRSNPPIRVIVRQSIVELDGKLWMQQRAGLIAYDRIPDEFWWYGPIPNPPWQSQETEVAEKDAATWRDDDSPQSESTFGVRKEVTGPERRPGLIQAKRT